MTGTTVPIAPIPLARSIRRLLAAPLILLAAGSAAVAGGAVLGDVRGIGLVAAGVVVAVLSLLLAVRLLTVRLDVEVATLRVRWLGGERRYTLVRGPVTRVALQGREAARLRPRFGAFGWGLGRARLRRDEQIELVRLTRSATIILVPTDRGRIGVAPVSEQQLLSALAVAARIQQRLDEVAERAKAFVMPASTGRPAVPISPPEPEPEPVGAEPASAAGGHRMLTGIERALIEERLTAERAVALAAAEAERQAAADAARMAPFLDAEAPAPAPVRARRRRRATWRRPAWFPLGRRQVAAPAVVEAAVTQPAAPAVAPAMPQPAPVMPQPAAAVPSALPRPEALPRPRRIPTERLVSYGIAVTPAVAAAAVWLAGYVAGRLELPAEQLRPVAVALLATGPAGALAGLIAQTWFPRLLGLVAITSLAALGLLGRALLG